jgi:CPA2 family monovalent cation:H+ antiporter-2
VYVDVWSAIQDVIVLLAAALLLGALAQRLQQSAMVGYLLAGVLLGPSGFGWISDPGTIRTFAELGVVLLIFSIGLELPAARMRALGLSALIAGTLQIAVTAVVVALIARGLGVTWATAWAVGLVSAPSSTACVMRLLEQRTELDSQHGRSSLGILLLQDAALVPLILVMSLLGDSGEGSAGLTLLYSVLRMGGLILVLYVAIRFVLPFALDRATVLHNRELPLLLAMVVVLSAAWGAHAMHISPVLGAFVAGILLAESPYALWIRADVGSFRTVFLTLFFASLAMLDDLSWVRAHYPWLLVSVPALLVIKAGVIVGVTAIARLPWRTGLATGLALAQTGEFSFVLLQIGTANGALTRDWQQLFIATTVISLLVTPYLLRVAAKIARASARASASDSGGAHGLQDHVIIVGMGPSGQAVYSALVGRTPLVLIDLNPRASAVTGEGVAFINGDATQEAVLDHAGIARARAAVVTLPDHHITSQVTQLMQALSPQLCVFTRVRYHRYASLLARSSTEVVDEEKSVGAALADRVGAVLGFSTAG